MGRPRPDLVQVWTVGRWRVKGCIVVVVEQYEVAKARYEGDSGVYG